MQIKLFFAAIIGLVSAVAIDVDYNMIEYAPGPWNEIFKRIGTGHTPTVAEVDTLITRANCKQHRGLNNYQRESMHIKDWHSAKQQFLNKSS